MSIQPNRIINRIVEQVDGSDWPPLRSRVYSNESQGEVLRIYRVPHEVRYATPLHFWLHALREELMATSHRSDFVGIAAHAMGHYRSFAAWAASDLEQDMKTVPSFGADQLDRFGLAPVAPDQPDDRSAYVMLASECRRSSVVRGDDWWVATFWSHGAGPSWRRKLERR